MRLAVLWLCLQSGQLLAQGSVQMPPEVDAPAEPPGSQAGEGDAGADKGAPTGGPPAVLDSGTADTGAAPGDTQATVGGAAPVEPMSPQSAAQPPGPIDGSAAPEAVDAPPLDVAAEGSPQQSMETPARDAEAPDALFAPVETVQVDMAAHQRQFLRTRLAKVESCAAEVETFVPTAILVLGAVVAIAGVAVGAAGTMACDDDCQAPPMAGIAVVGGLAAGIGGFLWLYWARDDLRELQSERYRLERDLEYIDLNTAGMPAVGVAGSF